MSNVARVFQDPASVTSLSIEEWSDLLPRLRSGRLLGHLSEMLQLHTVDRSPLPPAVQRQLLAAQTIAAVRATTTRWECGELARALDGTGIRVMVVKGASYTITGSLPGRGRFVDDVDLLVPAAQLPSVEERLLDAGWVSEEPDLEEVGYYRQWLHQIPPFVHTVRKTTLDVHHTIIAPWGGHRVDVEALFADGIATSYDGILVPSALDRCLIVAAHFVRSDAKAGAFRDLLDLDELMREAAPDAPSREALFARARAVGLSRALSITSHFASFFFGTPTVGVKPVALRTRAMVLVPDGATAPSNFTRLLRRGQQIQAFRAALPLRVMARRTIERRLGMTAKRD